MKNFWITSGAANLSRMAGLRWMRWRSPSAPRAATAPRSEIDLAEEAVDHVEKLVASECVNWQLSDLQSEHRRVFTNVITLDCPPYETLFGNDHVFAQSHVMGDISGFYKAFGVELSKDIHERLDHLSVELEFMHFLTYKESYSRCHDGPDKTQIVVDAQKKFVKNHIGRWVPLFCRMLTKKADSGSLQIGGRLSADWMDFEMAFLGVTPQPYTETDYRPATFSSPEGQTYECGAQDQGNELTMLLNEVGAQSFMDVKEKDKEMRTGDRPERREFDNGSSRALINSLPQLLQSGRH